MTHAHRGVVLDPARAVALAVLDEAMGTRPGRHWIRSHRWARFWAIEAKVEHADLVTRADELDGYGRRTA